VIVLAQSEERPFFDWSWIGRNLDTIFERAVEHVVLTGVAVAVGFLLSIGLVALALRWPRLYRPILAVSGILYTIPSLALFALLLAFLPLGFVTAEVALVSYSILILFRNGYTGITGVSDSVTEAADGMGYTRRQRFLRVELPLAVPVIVAGLRIATVTVVGLVTVTALLGQGGFGFFILDGFRRSIVFPTEIIVGTVLSAALAAVLDFGLLALEAKVTPWRRSA
jgi:osmoprotectant transport system permease protein